MGFIYLENARNTIGEVQVRILRETDEGFLDAEDIVSLLRTTDSISSQRINTLNTAGFETQIEANPFVARVDAFVNVDKDLIINVDEKKAFLRVFTREGHSFYLDTEGKPFPLSSKYTALVPVASGYIDIGIDEETGIPRPGESGETLSRITQLAKLIRQNEFLDALVSQIYLNSKGEYDLIPELGDFLIRMGSLENAAGKLAKLELWYKASSSIADWDQYRSINLTYEDQVVCTKK
jgi:cell division protein FtsQ